jgi:D-alanyl-D-alanine carboxypeptidase/D-alanyl-D-alanine-endopeptidase (penicillin-binding protein 4)
MMFSPSSFSLGKHRVTTRTIYSKNYYGLAELSSELNRIIAGQGVNFAVYVKSMEYGDSLYARNVNRSLTPASTMKILTAEAALLYLGPEYRFSTQLLTDNVNVKNGVLQGNVYIVLSGDPTLKYNDLGDLLMVLRNRNITGIQGNVYIDDSAYDGNVYGPGWGDKDKRYCYAAPISASIINHNCTLIRDLHGEGVSSVVTNVPDYNRNLFKTLFSHLPVRVYGTIDFATAPQKLSLLSQHNSKPLKLLIVEMLKKSDNIIAGALFKKMGQLYSKTPGSWENGSLAVSKVLRGKVGMNVSGLRILDGSGLSPENLATPTQMMQVLEFAYHHYDTTGQAFISALPIAGIDGTLKNRMGNIARKVRAKTGTITGVLSLAGYAVSADHEVLAFVIMINGAGKLGWQYKALEDQIATVLTQYKRFNMD